MTNAPVIGDVPIGLPSLMLPDYSLDILASAVQPALIIALLGSIDSLLTSLVADSMTRTRHNPNRELVGQGIGNTIAGFIGACPAPAPRWARWSTYAPASYASVGGNTRGHPARAGPGTGQIRGGDTPRGSCGHFGEGWVGHHRLALHHPGPPRSEEHLLVMVITMGLTVFLDLVTAVAIGLIAAMMASARQFERLELDSVISVPLLDRTFLVSKEEADKVDPYSARVGLVSLRGSFSVASANKLITTISLDIRDHEVVILDFTDTVYMDDSAALVVEQMIDVATDEDTGCIVMGLEGMPETTLKALNVLKDVPEDQFVKTLDEARETAKRMLND